MTDLNLPAPSRPSAQDRSAASSGAATGAVAIALRLEGALEFALALLAYRSLGGSWWMFAALFLVPDLSMIGYLANRTLGAVLYNIGHSYLSPAALAVAGYGLNAPWLHGPALIWAAHIGFDRMLGYGLKYRAAFGATHLGSRGRSDR